MTERTEHRDAGWLAQLAEKDRQIQALQASLQANLQTAVKLEDDIKHVLRENETFSRQILALQAAYEDTRDSLQRALAALAEHDARYRQQVQAKAAEYHNLPGWP